LFLEALSPRRIHPGDDGPDESRRGFGAILPQLGPQKRQSNLLERKIPGPPPQPIGHRNLLELLPVLQLRGIEDCGAEPELIPKAQGGKAKELQGVRHGIERAISVEARPRLNPVHLLLEVKLLEKRSEMCIGEE